MGEKGKHTQRFGQPHLDRPCGGTGKQNILQVGQYSVQRRNDGGMGQKSGVFRHGVPPKKKLGTAQDRPQQKMSA